jgi:ribosome-associated toxin RatA of RatAB toxin-antitoxin module
VIDPGRALRWARLGLAARFASGAGIFLCALLAAQTVFADKLVGAFPHVVVVARRDGDAVMVEARSSLTAEARIAWEVLTDYEHYPDFVPDLTSSQVLARTGNELIVEQKGVAGFFLFHFPLEVRLTVTEYPFELITSSAISGNFKSMTGAYQLILEGERLRVTYVGRLVPTFRLPPLLGITAIRIAVEKQFTGLVREIQRRQALQAKPAP